MLEYAYVGALMNFSQAHIFSAKHIWKDMSHLCAILQE